MEGRSKRLRHRTPGNVLLGGHQARENQFESVLSRRCPQCHRPTSDETQVAALEKQGAEGARILAARLTDHDPGVRLLAALVLGRMEEGHAHIEEVAACLGDSEPDVPADLAAAAGWNFLLC